MKRAASIMPPASLRRIAIVRCCGLGDVAQMTPLLRQIREDAPGAAIEIFVNGNVSCLLEGSPLADRIHALPVSAFRHGRQNPFLWHLWQQVRREGAFDLLLSLDLGLSKTALAGLARARLRAGFVLERQGGVHAFHAALPVPLDYPRNATHTSEWFLKLWSLATGAEDRGFTACLSHLKDIEMARLPDHIVLAPRAGNELVPGGLKEWPQARWSELARRLAGQNWTPVLMGRAGDISLEGMPGTAVDLQGRLTLTEAVRHLSRCGGLVGNDSGLFHLALAVGTPALGLFGPTATARTGPFRAEHGATLTAGLACVPCCGSVCSVPADGRPESLRPYCMTDLSPDRVFEQAASHFSRFRR